MRFLGNIFLLVSVLNLMSGCEKVLNFDPQPNDEDGGIAIYALAIPGQPFNVRISRSFTVNDNPNVIFSPDGSDYAELLDSVYESQVVIKDAQAELMINGSDRYVLHYNDEAPYAYECDYVPRAGDNIYLKVSAPDCKDVSATATIMKPLEVEVLSTQVVFKENGLDMPDDFADKIPDPGAVSSEYYNNPFDQYGMDSVMLITLRINDPGTQRNYYRLKVRGVADRKRRIMGDYYQYYYSASDIFTSSDVIFIDNLLVKPYCGWEARFSNVFDNHLFSGTSHTFTVETRKRFGENPRVDVELQSISKDLYYFLKSYQVFRMSGDDAYTTPIGLYSNIENGWGIMGTLSYDRHIIYY